MADVALQQQQGTQGPMFDPLTQGIRAALGHSHWLLAGSVAWTATVVLTLQGVQGSGTTLILAIVFFTTPIATALLVMADRIVGQGEFRASMFAELGWRLWLRLVAISGVTVAAFTVTLCALALLPLVPAPIGGISLSTSLAATGMAALLTPTVLVTAIEYPRAAWRRLWLVGVMAAARAPVAVLGGWVAAAALGLLAWKIQVLLLVLPAGAAVVLVAAARTALRALALPFSGSPRGGPTIFHVTPQPD